MVAWHGESGAGPGVQAYGAAGVQCCGHAYHQLRWAGGKQQVTMRSLVQTLQQRVSLWKRKRGATVILWPGEGPSRRNPPLADRGVPALPTSAAAGAPPGCPSCLVGAGLGEKQRWLWGREPLRAARSSSESTTQHRDTPNPALQSSHNRLPGGEAQVAGLSCRAQI